MAAMRDRAAVETVWVCRRDKTRWRIVQSHRVDRLAELVPAERTNAHSEKVYVEFATLRDRYRQVQP